MKTTLEALGAVKPIVAGATSLIVAMAKGIGLVEVINISCDCNRTGHKVSPGNGILALHIPA